MRVCTWKDEMSRDRPRQSEQRRTWLSGLAISVTTLVALFGFWHLAPGATFAIAVVALIGLVISLFVHP